MRRRVQRRRLFVLFVLLCTGLGIFALVRAGSGPRVSPPPKADPALTARVGLVVATNSPSFDRLLRAPSNKGVVVLFVQRGGPADEEGIEAGDVITSIDGAASPNDELAVTQLRSRPGQKRKLDVVTTAGRHANVSISARKPRNVSLHDLISPLIDKRPDDAILRFLRAQSDQSIDGYDESIADATKALDIDSRFVEALSVRAERQWAISRLRVDLSATERKSFAERALADWTRALRLESKNARALVGYSQALSQAKEPARAKRAAELARDVDPKLPSAYYALGLSEFAARKYELAAGPARQAIELTPFNVLYYELLANDFKQLDRSEDCDATVAAIVDLIPATSEKARVLRTCV